MCHVHATSPVCGWDFVLIIVPLRNITCKACLALGMPALAMQVDIEAAMQLLVVRIEAAMQPLVVRIEAAMQPILAHLNAQQVPRGPAAATAAIHANCN